MKKINRDLVLSIASVLCLISVVIGVTFAYYAANAEDKVTLKGNTKEFKVALNVTTLKASSNLIPLSDSLVNKAISKTSDKCVDLKGYDICSLYQITLTNTGVQEQLVGYLNTVSSGYTTSNLKYQLFTLSGSTYTAVTDAISVSNTADTQNFFKKSNANINITIANGKTTAQTLNYYLAIWLSDTGNPQPSDEAKTFVGTIGFESIQGNQLTSSFIRT